MGSSVSVRFVAVALAALGILCFAGTPSSTESVHFEASGTATITSVEGNILEADVEGEATPGGAFVGSLTERLVGFGAAAVGTVTVEFGDGTLTWNFADTVLPDGSIEGAWQVVKGTGEFAGVIGGGGEFSGASLDLESASFDLAGTLVFKD